MSTKKSKTSGFTLIELLIVIAIISVLSALVYIGIASTIGVASNTKKLQEVMALKTIASLKVFSSDFEVCDGLVDPQSTRLIKEISGDEGDNFVCVDASETTGNDRDKGFAFFYLEKVGSYGCVDFLGSVVQGATTYPRGKYNIVYFSDGMLRKKNDLSNPSLVAACDWSVADPSCQRNTYNCSHFSTRQEVLNVFNICSTDVHRLDGDNDGIPCESIR